MGFLKYLFSLFIVLLIASPFAFIDYRLFNNQYAISAIIVIIFHVVLIISLILQSLKRSIGNSIVKNEDKCIFKNKYIFVEIEPSEIPWLKVFTKTPFKEFSQCDKKTKDNILKALDAIEKEMIIYYKPDKVNIASFGNMLPRVHFHVMARFKEDSYFPEPMWGVKHRQAQLQLKDFDTFIKRLQKTLRYI